MLRRAREAGESPIPSFTSVTEWLNIYKQGISTIEKADRAEDRAAIFKSRRSMSRRILADGEAEQVRLLIQRARREGTAVTKTTVLGFVVEIRPD